MALENGPGHGGRTGLDLTQSPGVSCEIKKILTLNFYETHLPTEVRLGCRVGRCSTLELVLSKRIIA
jgi:hypothetical protein